MNRTEEYRALMDALRDTPPALDGSAARAKARAGRRKAGRRLGIPAASLVGAAAAFVLAVNVFPGFAMACSGIPFLKELAAAVAFSPSLSAAVEHDCVQYVGQSQREAGVSMTLEYLIADENQIEIFYSTNGAYELSCDLLDTDGAPISGWSSTERYSEEPLKHFSLHLIDTELPDTLVLECCLKPRPAAYPVTECDTQPDQPSQPQTMAEYRSDGVKLTFSVTLDASRMGKVKLVPVNRWVELDGNRLLIDHMKITPLRTVLYLDEDSANPDWLCHLDFWFEDSQGSRYDSIDGTLSASGEEDSSSFLTYYYQSLYYLDEATLTLKIDGAKWLEKSRPWVTLNLTDVSADWLPAGCTVSSVIPTGSDTEVCIEAPTNDAPLSWNYRDPEGNVYHCSSAGTSAGYLDETGVTHPYRHYSFLCDYPWDTVEFELAYTSLTSCETPISIPIA